MARLQFGEPMVTQADAARLLGVSRSYVSHLVRSGRLGTITVRGMTRLLLRDVDRLRQERAERLEGQLAKLEGR